MGQAGSYELNTTSTPIPTGGSAPSGAFQGGGAANNVFTYAAPNSEGTVIVTPVPNTAYIAAPSVTSGDGGSSKFACINYRLNSDYTLCSCQPLSAGCGQTTGFCNLCPAASVSGKTQGPANFYCIAAGSGYSCSQNIPNSKSRLGDYLVIGVLIFIIILAIFAMLLFLVRGDKSEKVETK